MDPEKMKKALTLCPTFKDLYVDMAEIPSYEHLIYKINEKKEEMHVIGEGKYFFSQEYLSWVLQANVLYNKCAV